MSRKKPTKRRGKRARLVLMTTMGIALMLAGSWSYQLVKLDQSIDRQKNQLLQEKNQLIAANEQLRQNIEKLNTPSYIEQLAREKLGLVKKGEILIAPKK